MNKSKLLTQSAIGILLATTFMGIIVSYSLWQENEKLQKTLVGSNSKLENLEQGVKSCQEAKDKTSKELSKLQKKQFEFEPLKENEFRLECLRPGDKVGSMNVEWLNSFTKQYQPSRNEPMNYDNFVIQFSGEIILDGEYHVHAKDDLFMQQETVCFSITDETSLSRLPKPLQGSIKGFFCFTNKEFALSQFGPPGSNGKATVVIDEFRQIVISIGGPVNSARLIEVKKKEPVQHQ